MGRFHDQIFPVKNGMNPVYPGFQWKKGDLFRGNFIPGRDKAYTNIAGHHITNGLGMGSAAGYGRVKILFIEKFFDQVPDAGPFML